MIYTKVIITSQGIFFKNKLKFPKTYYLFKMKFEELERKVELLLPNLGPEGQMLVELFMPFCRGLHEENARLHKENKALRDQLSRNSLNSSKPPSQDFDRPVKRRIESGVTKRPAGGQEGKLKDNPFVHSKSLKTYLPKVILMI